MEIPTGNRGYSTVETLRNEIVEFKNNICMKNQKELEKLNQYVLTQANPTNVDVVSILAIILICNLKKLVTPQWNNRFKRC